MQLKVFNVQVEFRDRIVVLRHSLDTPRVIIDRKASASRPKRKWIMLTNAKKLMINVTKTISLLNFHFHWPFCFSTSLLMHFLLFNNCSSCDVQWSKWRDCSICIEIMVQLRLVCHPLAPTWLTCDHVDSFNRTRCRKYEHTMHVFTPTHYWGRNVDGSRIECKRK